MIVDYLKKMYVSAGVVIGRLKKRISYAKFFGCRVLRVLWFVRVTLIALLSYLTYTRMFNISQQCAGLCKVSRVYTWFIRLLTISFFVFNTRIL